MFSDVARNRKKGLLPACVETLLRGKEKKKKQPMKEYVLCVQYLSFWSGRVSVKTQFRDTSSKTNYAATVPISLFCSGTRTTLIRSPFSFPRFETYYANCPDQLPLLNWLPHCCIYSSCRPGRKPLRLEFELLSARK